MNEAEVENRNLLNKLYETTKILKRTDCRRI